MKLILLNKQHYHMREQELLKEAASSFNLETIDINIGDKNIRLDCKEDYILFRTTTEFSKKTSQLESRIINKTNCQHFSTGAPIKIAEIASKQLGIDIIKNVIISKDDNKKNLVESLGGYPIIIKPFKNNGLGVGVFKVEDDMSLLSTCKLMFSYQPKSKLIVQNYFEHSKIYKLLVLNNELIACLEKPRCDDVFEAIHHIQNKTYYQHSSCIENLKVAVQKLSRLAKMDFCSIDVMVDDNGNMCVLSIAPHFDFSIYQSTDGESIASKIITALLNKHEKIIINNRSPENTLVLHKSLHKQTLLELSKSASIHNLPVAYTSEKSNKISYPYLKLAGGESIHLNDEKKEQHNHQETFQNICAKNSINFIKEIILEKIGINEVKSVIKYIEKFPIFIKLCRGDQVEYLIADDYHSLQSQCDYFDFMRYKMSLRPIVDIKQSFHVIVVDGKIVARNELFSTTKHRYLHQLLDIVPTTFDPKVEKLFLNIITAFDINYAGIRLVMDTNDVLYLDNIDNYCNFIHYQTGNRVNIANKIVSSLLAHQANN